MAVWLLVLPSWLLLPCGPESFLTALWAFEDTARMTLDLRHLFSEAKHLLGTDYSRFYIREILFLIKT